MENHFINLFLLVFIINIIVLYLYQQTRVNDDYLKPINDLSLNDIPINEGQNQGDSLTKCQNNINCYLDREANRKLGPVLNFHQTFNNEHIKLNSNSPQKKANVLGWRNHYLTKNNKYLVSPDKNFDNVSTKNFLQNMESVKNIYRGGC